MFMAVMLAMIGATLRIERRIEPRERGAEPTQHVFQHMVTPDTQTVADYLHIGVAIADVPSDARQFRHRDCRDFDQGLGLAINAHDSAVVQDESITVTQRDGMQQVEQELSAMLAVQHNPSPVTLGSIEHDVVNGCCITPVSGRHDGPSAFHNDAVVFRTGSAPHRISCSGEIM
jgi:hypothetical protein